MDTQIITIYVICDEEILLLAKRRKSMRKRLRSHEKEKQISSRRQIVETAFSCITNLLPRCVRAVSEQGFILRILSAILAYSFSFVS